MPESDVTKMKVADLKRELKMRGLPLNGNKNELQDRLQTALLEGDISLEDSAIADAIADEIDDDVSLTDEDEHKLLGDDHEDLLLKSPVSTPTASTATLPELLTTTPSTQSKSEATNASTPAKKIVLKRNNSLQSSTTLATPSTTTTSKENSAPKSESIKPVSDTEEKTTKTPHKPIVAGGSASDSKDATKGVDKKIVELSIKERLELRAKKFGITVDANAPGAATTATAAAASPAVNKSSSASIKANNGNKETDEQQKEALKRRAERFGCVVPEKNPKTVVDEKLQKRKERFGGAAATAVPDTDSKAQGDWAEKARARLERFKATPAAATETTK